MRTFKTLAVEYQCIERFLKEKVASVSAAMTITEIFNTIKDQVKNKQQVADAIKSMHKKHLLRRMSSFGSRGHVYWYDPVTQVTQAAQVEKSITQALQTKAVFNYKDSPIPSIKINPNSIIISSDKYTVTIEI